jgi:predicted nucleic acid-binding protein
MIFVDANVLIYAVGGPHPLRAEARAFFEESLSSSRPLATSAEVLQELIHVYLPVERMAAFDAALVLAESSIATVWPIEQEDVRHARALADVHRGLAARNLLHLACCRRRGAQGIKTFDRALAAAFAR